jgi:hypothetical protein
MYRPIIDLSYLLGVLNIFLAIVHICWAVFVAIDRNYTNLNLKAILYITQTLIPFGILLFVGITLLRHGWRMDPRVRFAFLLVNLLIVYYMIRAIAIHQIC